MNTDTRLIELTQSQFSIVDTCDFEWLNQFNWHVIKHKTTRGVKYYAGRSIKKNRKRTYYYMHRVIAERAFQDFDATKDCDHRDGSGLNNSRQNLRVCTHRQNMWNRVKSLGLTSRYRGVFWNNGKQKWTARICVNGKHIHIGHFTDEVVAAAWYVAYAIFYFGSFANLEPAPE